VKPKGHNKPVPAEDVELFRKTVGPVEPVRQDRHVPAPRRRAGRARFTRVDPFTLEESPAEAPGDALAVLGENLSHRRPGVPESVLRRLRRGEFRIEGEIDLHGLTVAQATKVLKTFLAGALSRHARCVRVIHGKGLRSGNRGPVLKNAVSTVLLKSPAVVAFVSAAPSDGGTGAVYVLLSSA
jgi:DNA-nicking Smr family endonuclease